MKLARFVQLGLFLGLSISTSASDAQADGDDIALSTRDFGSGIKDVTTCAGCEALLVTLKGVAHLGNKAFVNTITTFCKKFTHMDPDVCAGAIALEGPILAHSIREMKIPSDTSKLFCTTVFGLCNIPPVKPNTVVFPKPKPAGAARPPVSGQPPLKIVHMSDIHVDLSYQVGANTQCNKNICCRPYTEADQPENTASPAGPFGDPNCDTPLSLEQSMYTAIEKLIPDAAFTMFTGDVVEGAVWLVNNNEIVSDLTSAYSNMSSLNTVYGVVGNHDVAPVNSFPPAGIDTSMSSQYVYDTLSTEWTPFLGPQVADQSRTQSGSYSTLHKDTNLRIISINTNFWYKQNFWLYEEVMESDPNGQFAWFINELQNAESANERVYILGHMPMGSSDALHDASNQFNQIIQRYDATIAGLFFGHTHKDEFQIAYSDYNQRTSQTATAVSYVAPALVPSSGHPSFRVYSVDPITFGILDYTTYFANMTDPSFQQNPIWQVLYSVKQTYAPDMDPAAELTPQFWHDLTVTFENDDGVFQDFMARKTREFAPSTCTGDCKTAELCKLRAAESQYNCVQVTPGIHFKRDEHGHSHAVYQPGDCEGSKLGEILHGLKDNIHDVHQELTRRGLL